MNEYICERYTPRPGFNYHFHRVFVACPRPWSERDVLSGEKLLSKRQLLIASEFEHSENVHSARGSRSCMRGRDSGNRRCASLSASNNFIIRTLSSVPGQLDGNASVLNIERA